jgi:hypothetical protein
MSCFGVTFPAEGGFSGKIGDMTYPEAMHDVSIEVKLEEAYVELIITINPELSPFYDEFYQFYLSIFTLKGIKVIESSLPNIITKDCYLEISEEQTSCEILLSKKDASQQLCLFLGQHDDSGNYKSLFEEQVVSLISTCIKSKLFEFGQFETYVANHQADGSEVPKNVHHLYRLIKGFGPHFPAGDSRVDSEQCCLLNSSLFSTFIQYGSTTNTQIDLCDFEVCFSWRGIEINVFTNGGLEKSAFLEYFLASDVGKSIVKIASTVFVSPLSEVYDVNLDAHPSIEAVEDSQSFYGEEELSGGDPISHFNIPMNPSDANLILLSEGVLEERVLPGSGKLNKVITARGRRYGVNELQDYGGLTAPRWYRERFDELREKYLTITALENVKRAKKDKNIGTTYRELLSITKQLKSFQVGLSGLKANKILIDKGLLEEKIRLSLTNNSELKSYKSLTRKGLEYGVNQPSAFSMETAPFYYTDKFIELVQTHIKPKADKK